VQAVLKRNESLSGVVAAYLTGLVARRSKPRK
jgi:hypothetical protein